MGNWRAVNIDGTIDPAQVAAARKACLSDYRAAGEQPYHALAFSPPGSLCGIDEWMAPRMNVTGNCYERDFEVEDIAEALRIVQKAAPSLNVKVHCGGDYEDKKCVATITAADGAVTVGPPEVETLPEQSEGDMTLRMMKLISR